jgi:hypothetical protein
MIVLAILGVLFLGVLVVALVLFFRDSAYKNALLASEQARIDVQERCDRLTEALARSGKVDLVLPQPRQAVLEPSPGWFDPKPPQVQVKVSPLGGKTQ